MNKKISLLILFTILVFFPALQVSATQVYVGVQISNTEKPSGGTFDLLAGTQLSVLNGTPPGSTTVSGSSVTTANDTAIGDTIWTPLINLTSGSTYTARLSVPLCFGDGKYDSRGPYCWFLGTDSQSCTTLCSDKGGTTSSECQEPDDSCTMMIEFGLDCDYCYEGEDPYPYFYPYGSTGYCYYAYYSYPGYNTCDFGYSGYTRICACQFQTGTFNFGFTANF